MSDNVTLESNGKEFSGWTHARLSMGIEMVASGFTLGVTQFPNSTGNLPRWVGQEPCKVKINGETLITGFIDIVAEKYANRSHAIEISGRDKTADLVDCSDMMNIFSNKNLPDIAREICTKFNIPVTGGKNLPRRDIFVPQIGDTLWNELSRLAALDKVILLPNAKGGLLITTAGAGGAMPGALNFPDSGVISASQMINWQDRFSNITALAQGDATANAQKGVAIDHRVNRYRPYVVHAEIMAAGESIKNRAKWELAIREGKCYRWRFTVPGWMQNGVIWQPNKTVKIVAPPFGLDRKLLIASVEFLLDQNSGKMTNLELVLPTAFNPALTV